MLKFAIFRITTVFGIKFVHNLDTIIWIRTKYRVVHQLKEVLLERRCAFFTSLCVEINVRFQPGRLLELKNAMDFLQNHPLLQIEFQISSVYDIFLLIVQIWGQLRAWL